MELIVVTAAVAPLNISVPFINAWLVVLELVILTPTTLLLPKPLNCTVTLVGIFSAVKLARLLLVVKITLPPVAIPPLVVSVPPSKPSF